MSKGETVTICWHEEGAATAYVRIGGRPTRESRHSALSMPLAGAAAAGESAPIPPSNPIGNAFARLTSLLRAGAKHTITALWDPVRAIFGLFCPTECENDFGTAGYGPDQTVHALVYISRLF
ncbi:Transposase-like protein precursor [Bosea sp. LC85]|nr:Transposase-like protein precursor [Bosea sp. LC85]